MSNFYDLGTGLIDISSIAYIDTETKEVILKSGYVFSAAHFTSLEVSQMSDIVRKSNTVYDVESVLFLDQEEVQSEIDKFATFMGYPKEFGMKYTKKNDSVYTLEATSQDDFAQWVYHYNAHDSTRVVLETVERLYQRWLKQLEGGSEMGEYNE